MALLNDDRWKLEKMYTRLRASEASEPIFKYISALKTYNSSQISIYSVDKSLFVGTICP